MVKFKPVRDKKKKKTPGGLRAAIPCLVFLLSAMALLMLLFYAILRSS